MHSIDRTTGGGSAIGIILAGTHDWSAGGLDALVPRPLAPVVNLPLIVHLITWFARAGIDTIILCVNRDGDAFRRLLGDGSGLHVDLYYHEDRMPRGPAGCAKDAIAMFPADRYLIAEANSIPCVKPSDLFASMDESNLDGVVVVGDSERSRVLGEQPARPLGVYLLKRAALDLAPSKGFEDIKEGLLPRLHEKQLRTQRYFVGKAAPRLHDVPSYLQLNRWALRELITVEGGPVAATGAVVAPTARLAPDARISGHCLIGDHSEIGAGAVLVGPVVIGRRCFVGAGAVVRNCVLWDGSEVAPGGVLHGEVVTPLPAEIEARAGGAR